MDNSTIPNPSVEATTQKTLSTFEILIDARKNVVIMNTHQNEIDSRKRAIKDLVFKRLLTHKKNIAWLYNLFFFNQGETIRGWIGAVENQKPKIADFSGQLGDFEDAQFMNGTADSSEIPRTNIGFVMFVINNAATESDKAATYQNVAARILAMEGVQTVIGVDAQRIEAGHTLHLAQQIWQAITASYDGFKHFLGRSQNFGNALRSIEADLNAAVVDPKAFEQL